MDMTWMREWTNPVLYVDESKVNIDDLLNSWRPGAIVRVRGNPHEAIKHSIGGMGEDFAYVAGMVSEET